MFTSFKEAFIHPCDLLFVHDILGTVENARDNTETPDRYHNPRSDIDPTMGRLEAQWKLGCPSSPRSVRLKLKMAWRNVLSIRF